MSKYHMRVRSSRNVFYLVIILAAALFWSELALADEARPVVATGMAAILQGNMDISRDRAIEDALRKRDIPYRIYGGLSFYQRKEIKDVLFCFLNKIFLLEV